MLLVPQKGRLRYESNLGTVGSATPGTSITTGTPATTKGSVVVPIATTAFDAYLMQVTATDYSLAATNANLMVDIQVGAATEEVLIANLMMGGAGGSSQGTNGVRSYLFPLYIPAGTRISAKAAGQRVSTAFRIGIELWGGDGVPPFRVGRKVTTYGVGTVPTGTTIVPGASGAAGSHTQITATTSEAHFAFLPGFQPGDDTTKLDLEFVAAMGIGAATEEELSTIWRFKQNSGEQVGGPFPSLPAFADVASGTRLTLRFSCSGALDTGNYNGCIYAVS